MNNVAEVTILYSSKVKPIERVKICSSKDAYNVVAPFYSDEIEHREVFKIILLNRANKVLGVYNVSTGGVSACIVDPKVIFQAALKANASSVILSHNHPSGELKPSSADMEITKKLVKGGELLEIKVLDHLILTPDNNFFSFTDEGVL